MVNHEGLVCKRSYISVIGCLMQDPNLLDDTNRPLCREDFNTEKFYEMLFVAIYNLHMGGCVTIDEFAIDSYLSSYTEQYKIFQDNNGIEYLTSAREMANMENYEYFYHRLRKYSLLRYYESKNFDTRKIFDSTIVDVKQAEKEQNKFDNYTENEIIGAIESDFVITPTMKYCTNTLTTDCQAGDGLDILVKGYMITPDMGVSLNSKADNTIFRGARKGCLYMRSSIQGGGKSRMAAGDACRISIPYYYDIIEKEWVFTGFSEPTLYITTEMEVAEIQTLFIATVSGVNEDHILAGKYEDGEYERVMQANQYITSSPLYICHIPDFSIEDIKNIVKKYNREHGVDYFFFDYIHSSLRLMAEVNSKSKMGLKEHQLLLVFVTELKALCQQLHIFMFTASQLNGEAVNAPVKDMNLLAGSKALANKLDVGVISMPPSKTELKKIETITHKMIGCPIPNMCTWVYKVRRGKITRVVVWSQYDLGIMRVRDLFVTTNNFELIGIDFTKIEYVENVIKKHSINISDTNIPLIEEKEEKTEKLKLVF